MSRRRGTEKITIDRDGERRSRKRYKTNLETRAGFRVDRIPDAASGSGIIPSESIRGSEKEPIALEERIGPQVGADVMGAAAEIYNCFHEEIGVSGTEILEAVDMGTELEIDETPSSDHVHGSPPKALSCIPDFPGCTTYSEAQDQIDGAQGDECPIHVNNMEDTEELLSAFKSLCRWQILLSVSVVCGTVRLTVEQYSVFRKCLNWLLKKSFPNETPLPDYSTLQRTFIPLLRKWSLVKSVIQKANVDSTKSGARLNLTSSSTADSKIAEYALVLPSESARRDVSHRETWDLFRHNRHADNEELPGIVFDKGEDIPLVRDRDRVFNICSNYFLVSSSIERDSFTPNVFSGESLNAPTDVFIYCSRSPDFPDANNIPEVHCNLDSKIFSFQLRTGSSRLVKAARSSSGVARTATSFLPKHIRSGKFFARETPVSSRRKLWSAGDVCTLLYGSEDLTFCPILVYRASQDQHRVTCALFGGSRAISPLDQDMHTRLVCTVAIHHSDGLEIDRRR